MIENDLITFGHSFVTQFNLKKFEENAMKQQNSESGLKSD